MADTAQDSRDVEILVHVTAPARVADDTTYRQLAQAYLDFQPDAAINLLQEDLLSNPMTAGHEHDKTDSPQARLIPSQSQEFDDVQFVSPMPMTIGSQDLSFQSVVDNRSSPRIRTYKQRANEEAATPLPGDGDENTNSQRSWDPPPSHISDSYPLPNATAMSTSPTRMLQPYMSRPATRDPASQARSSSPRSSAPSSPSPRRSPRISRLLSGSRPTHLSSSRCSLAPPQKKENSESAVANVPKTIPVTPLYPKEAAVAPSPQPTGSQAEVLQAVSDITHISGTDLSLPAATSSPRAESEPPPAKRCKIDVDIPASAALRDATTLIRSSSDTGPTSRPISTLPVAHLSALEVFSPSPPVDVVDLDPSSMVSEKLAKLAVDLSSRYRPVIQRDIHSLERGYWAIDCSLWPIETRLSTWEFLFLYIHNGLASWGVWCRRGASHDWLRLYCWGHLAKHTYLLLYLASGRHLKYTGAEWKDAGNEAVIQVLAQEKQG